MRFEIISDWNKARARISALKGKFKSSVFRNAFKLKPYNCDFLILSDGDMLKKQRVNSVRDYFRQKREEYKKRKRYEAATELVSFFEEHNADPELHSVVKQLWEDMKCVEKT